MLPRCSKEADGSLGRLLSVALGAFGNASSLVGAGAGAGAVVGAGAGAATGAPPPQVAQPPVAQPQPQAGLQQLWQANRPLTRSANGWQQHFFSQPQPQAGFSQQVGLQQENNGLQQQAGFSQQAGAGAQQAGAGAQQAGTGAAQQVGAAQPQPQPHLWQSNRSFRPQNRSRTGVTCWQPHFDSQQVGAAAQQVGAGAAQQVGAGSGAQHFAAGSQQPHEPQPPHLRPSKFPPSSMANPWQQRATLNRSAPTNVLLFIEQSLLYNEPCGLGVPTLANHKPECVARGFHPKTLGGSSHG